MTGLFALAGLEQAIANLLADVSRVTEPEKPEDTAPVLDFPEVFAEMATESDVPRPVFTFKRKEAILPLAIVAIPVVPNLAPPVMPVPTQAAPVETPVEAPVEVAPPVVLPIRLDRTTHLAFAARLVPIATPVGDALPKDCSTPKALDAVERLGPVLAKAPAESDPEQPVPAPETRPLTLMHPAEPVNTIPEKASSPTPVERTEKPQSAAEPAPIKPPAIARDIKLEVIGNDHRVELHLTERAGEVRVSVRTPDATLAGDLRQNLPVLSTRLDQAGFRTEILHLPAAAQADGLRTVAGSSPADHRPADSNAHTDQRQRRDDAPQDQQPQNRKQKGKEFEWLMSSLR